MQYTIYGWERWNTMNFLVWLNVYTHLTAQSGFIFSCFFPSTLFPAQIVPRVVGCRCQEQLQTTQSSNPKVLMCWQTCSASDNLMLTVHGQAVPPQAHLWTVETHPWQPIIVCSSLLSKVQQPQLSLSDSLLAIQQLLPHAEGL